MFAATLDSIGYCTKKIPTLTTREPSVVRSIRFKPSNVSIFESVPSVIMQAYESVKTIKKHLARVYQFRVELLHRDIEQIFAECKQFCEVVLGHSTSEAMFEYYDRDHDEKLNEEEQMSIFTRLLTLLYEKKEELIQGQWYREHATMLGVIKSIEDELPEMQKLIRQRITQVKLEYVSRRKRKALSEYQVEAQKSQKQFLQEKEQRMKSLRYQQQQQRWKLEQTLNESNPERLYKARPSTILREVKDLTLLEKLAPYKHQKKREYECEQLNHTIAAGIEKEQSRINKTIEVHKNLERRGLHQHQRRKLQIEEDRYSQKYNELLTSLDQERQRVEKHEHNSSHMLMLSDRKQANDRVDWIGKAAKVQHSRADSLNIARIVMQHRDVLQFNNSIERLTTLATNQGSENGRDFRYFGSESIQSTRKLLNNSNSKTAQQQPDLEATLVKRPGKHEPEVIAKYQQPLVPILNPQRSLTDLYDHNLNIIK